MIVEVSRFRLVPGTDEPAFLRAAEESQTGFLANQPGFQGRELLRGDAGWWMDIVRFESRDAAQAALSTFAGNPSVRDFEHVLDVSTADMSHWERIKAW